MIPSCGTHMYTPLIVDTRIFQSGRMEEITHDVFGELDITPCQWFKLEDIQNYGVTTSTPMGKKLNYESLLLILDSQIPSRATPSQNNGDNGLSKSTSRNIYIGPLLARGDGDSTMGMYFKCNSILHSSFPPNHVDLGTHNTRWGLDTII